MHKRHHSFIGLCGLFSLTLFWAASSTAQDVQALVGTCAACHGSDGNSLTPDYPKIAGLGEKYLFKQLQDIRATQVGDGAAEGGRKIDFMAGMLASLSDNDLAAIAAHFAQQPMTMTGATAGQKVKLNSGTEVDSLALGENLYRYGDQRKGVPACSGCHSPKGLGNEPAGYPRLGGQYPAYIANQLKAFRAGERTNDGEAQIMRQVAELMSDADITAVANYIGGLH